ncbi:phage/plasmid primase, P4 family [Pseudomonas sp. StFLB209]|uniref:hypothetical protein n=1 Tax=Pseudomonas sp. StFLB209 TaxID=1028989 RepID=UPI0004F81D75|nr:hypothetical protein [Pseudomonas sp. StFLB209]BAP44635.1 phage/plasmid primase, P4 family [Pseudomonas sp. StFLB209]
MSLSIAMAGASVRVAGVASTPADVTASEAEREDALAGLQVPDDLSPKAGKKSGSGQGQVVDTLLDRLSELHERLRRLRQELRAAVNSPNPDIVRLPRILSLQRQIMVTNGDIQLVSGLLINALNRTTGSGVSTQA